MPTFDTGLSLVLSVLAPFLPYFSAGMVLVCLAGLIAAYRASRSRQ